MNKRTLDVEYLSGLLNSSVQANSTMNNEQQIVTGSFQSSSYMQHCIGCWEEGEKPIFLSDVHVFL